MKKLIIWLTVLALCMLSASALTGDHDTDGVLTDEDAVYLLYHSLLPDKYPLPADQSGDHDADGKVTSADAIYLLYHTLLPDAYPIA